MNKTMKLNVVTEEMVKEIAERMANKMECFKISKKNYTDNYRECPFYSEFKGMEDTLKILGMEFEYEFDDEYEISAVIVDGYRVEVR